MDHISTAYPRNQWWVAARPSEISTSPFERRILGDRIVFFRTEGGEATALAGLCPHRMYPLALGKVMGDEIECGYHGFRFKADGRCSLVPSQDSAPSAVGIRRYPVVEQAHLVWIWTGDPALADPALIPDVSAYGPASDGAAPGWHVIEHRAYHVPARYTLLLDNLMDLSHLAFIHARSAPINADLPKIPIEVSQNEGRVALLRRAQGIGSGPMEMGLFQYSGPINLHLESRYLGPAMVQTGLMTEAVDANDGPRHLAYMTYMHALTPETPNSCHYFVTEGRDFHLDNAALDETSRQMHDILGQEDVDVCTLVEQALQNGDIRQPEISVKADTGGILVRRALAAQIAKEAAQLEAAA